MENEGPSHNMKHLISEETMPVPPPLPPPLPKTKPKLPGLVSPRISPLNSIPRLIRQAFHDNYLSILSHNTHVEPVLQDGPQCGIVALSMASQMLFGKHCTTSDLLAEAKSLNYTKSGEMFSVYNMAKLATSALGSEATVISNLLDHKEDILDCICTGCPVLIPYDADKNHEPCFNEGRNAHWAVLTGLCVALAEDLSDSDWPCLDEGNRIFTLPSGELMSTYLRSSRQTCVYAYQGKSQHLALWDFDSLLMSNENMFEVTKKYSSEDMLLPDNDDVLSELRDKAVVLKSKIE